MNSVKPLSAPFSGTGMDPDPERRRILRRRVKRKLKRDKDSSTSTGSSSSEGGGPMETNMLEQRSKIQHISDISPGLLPSEALQTMKEHLLQASGTPWGVDDSSLPPLVLQYVRQQCGGKTSPPVMREMSTLATLADNLLLGRPAEALDIAFQRLKSLEMSAIGGYTWVTSQRVELLPRTEMGLAGRGEVQLAQREAQLDAKAKGSSGSTEKGGKGKQSNKGKEQKGKGKGRGGAKEDGKKGAQRRPPSRRRVRSIPLRGCRGNWGVTEKSLLQ